MNTRTTFEDRLLDELKKEIGLRGGAAPDTGTRRLITPRRITVAVAACVVAGLAVVVAPGSPAGSTAYAVERHRDGSVTLTLKKAEMDAVALSDLKRQLRADGISVSWGRQVPVSRCIPVDLEDLTTTTDDRDHSDKDGFVPSVRPLKELLLHPGDTVVFDDRGRPVKPADGEAVRFVPVCISDLLSQP